MVDARRAAPVEITPRVTPSDLDDILKYVSLEVLTAGSYVQQTDRPVGRNALAPLSYVLWFVRDAQYSIRTAGATVEGTAEGGVLLRPGAFCARLVRPSRMPVAYVRLTAKLFGTVDLFRLFSLPVFLRLPTPSRAHELTLQALEECRLGRPAARMAAQGLFLQALALLLREVQESQPIPPPVLDPRLLKAIRLIQHGLGQALRVEDLAAAVGFHPSHFWRVFKGAFGMSPSRCIRLARLRRARELLADPDLTIAAVGKHVGYADPSYFHRVFLRTVGMTPGAFRAAPRGGGQ